jgi:hypothetical protein
MFNNDNSLLNLSFSMNAKTGRLTNVTLNLERVDRIITAVKLAVPTSYFPLPDEASGNIHLSLDVKYNNDVKLDAVPNASYVYEEPNKYLQ